MRLVCRKERPADVSAVEDIVKRAFADVSYSDQREFALVARLRETDAFVPELSLIAEADGQAVGHVLLTKVVIRADTSAIASLALAPLSVVPGFQRRGVGSQLVRYAHERAAKLGFGSIMLIGSPDYYGRFGYEPMSNYPITVPFDVPSRNCMVFRLTDDGLRDVSGRIEYPNAFLDH